MAQDTPQLGQQAAAQALWERSDQVGDYATRDLRPVETLLLARYSEAFRQRVLEIGCGAGRVSGYLAELAEHYTGIDVAPEMVAYCQRAYPAGTFAVGDIRNLAEFAEVGFDVIFPTFNIIDILSHTERQETLRALRRMLVPGGMLVLSTHNRGSEVRGPSLRTSDPLRFAVDVLRFPRRWHNRRGLLPAERDEADYAIRNDEAHDYRGLHYYITRQAGERQLQACGFELLECLDLDGRAVAPEAAAAHTPELHFVARRV